MTNYDVVKKLIGEVQPVGESHIDTHRFSNLTAMCELVEKLYADIEAVAAEQSRHEASIKRAGIYADDFLKRLEQK